VYLILGNLLVSARVARRREEDLLKLTCHGNVGIDVGLASVEGCGCWRSSGRLALCDWLGGPCVLDVPCGLLVILHRLGLGRLDLGRLPLVDLLCEGFVALDGLRLGLYLGRLALVQLLGKGLVGLGRGGLGLVGLVLVLLMQLAGELLVGRGVVLGRAATVQLGRKKGLISLAGGGQSYLGQLACQLLVGQQVRLRLALVAVDLVHVLLVQLARQLLVGVDLLLGLARHLGGLGVLGVQILGKRLVGLDALADLLVVLAVLEGVCVCVCVCVDKTGDWGLVTKLSTKTARENTAPQRTPLLLLQLNGQLLVGRELVARLPLTACLP